MLRDAPDGHWRARSWPPSSRERALREGVLRTLGADSLASSANREPRFALFYATDDDTAAGTVEREDPRRRLRPGEAGGFADAGRLEGPDGDLSQGGLKASCSTRPGSRNPRSDGGEGMSNHRNDHRDVDLPDYAPVPQSALGPALNEQGYYVGRVEGNLYWITDGTYQCAFLTTWTASSFSTPRRTIGNNIQRAIDEIASANGVSNQGQLSRLPAPSRGSRRRGVALRQDGHGGSVTRRRASCCCAMTIRPGRRRGERSRIAGRSRSAASASTYVVRRQPLARQTSSSHLPDHRRADADRHRQSGLGAVFQSNLPRTSPLPRGAGHALAYSWKHFIGGHLGRLGTRDT